MSQTKKNMNDNKNIQTVDVLNSIILSHREQLFKIPKEEHVVFVMSGGLDSTIGAAMIIEEWGSFVHPLFIRRNARATKYEEKAFDLIANDFRTRYKNKFLVPKKIETEVPPSDIKLGLTEQRLKSVGHAMRNAVLQSIGV